MLRSMAMTATSSGAEPDNSDTIWPLSQPTRSPTRTTEELRVASALAKATSWMP
jgi:hypothetical protein